MKVVRGEVAGLSGVMVRSNISGGGILIREPRGRAQTLRGTLIAQHESTLKARLGRINERLSGFQQVYRGGK